MSRISWREPRANSIKAVVQAALLEGKVPSNRAAKGAVPSNFKVKFEGTAPFEFRN